MDSAILLVVSAMPLQACASVRTATLATNARSRKPATTRPCPATEMESVTRIQVSATVLCPGIPNYVTTPTFASTSMVAASWVENATQLPASVTVLRIQQLMVLLARDLPIAVFQVATMEDTVDKTASASVAHPTQVSPATL